MKRRLFLVIILLGIILSMFATPRINSSQSAIDLGLNYLTKSQNPDGSWGKQLDLQGSAFAVVALEKAGQSCTGDKAHLNKENLTAAYDLALRLLGDPQNTTAQSLLALQNTEGGWGDPYTTAIVLMGLAKYGATNPQAVTYLKSLQNTDGSWGINGTDEMTAIVLYALILNGERGDEVQKGMNWLKEHQTPQGGWSNIPATAWAVLAMNRYGEYENEVKKAATYLIAKRFSDGGWGLGKEPVSAVYPSAMAVWALASVEPQNAAIKDGIAYLQSQRYNEAGWYNQELAIPTTLAVAEVKHRLGKLERLEQAGLWMEKVEAHNTAALAARLSYLMKYGQASPETKIKLQTDLLAMVNTDGGWGSWLGYESDPYDTSMALRALWDAGYANPPVYQKAVAWLRNHQLSDGSFNMRAKEMGQVYLTAHLALTLEKLKPLVDVQLVLDPSVCWIVGQRKADGSFGRGVLDTAEALQSVASALTVEQVKNTQSYLEKKQLPDGSWEQDDLTTALVLKALDAMKPNLSIAQPDISFSPEVAYTNGEVTVTALIKNNGLMEAGNVLVRLYDGQQSQGRLVGEKTIAEIAAKGVTSVTFVWKAGTMGLHEICLVIDPDHTVSEGDENDNTASKNIQVVSKIDLAVGANDIQILPRDPDPSDDLTMKAVIHNLGGTNSGAFNVKFSLGDPKAGGTVLGVVNCSDVPGQGQTDVTFQTKLPLGDHRIFVSIDDEESIGDDNRNNNIASQSLTISNWVDLSIGLSDVSFSKTEAVEGDLITIQAQIMNKRRENVSNVPVAFYLGDPSKGGTLIEKTSINNIDGYRTGTAQINWNTAEQIGGKTVFVVIDPEGTLMENDRTNNIAYGFIHLAARTDLQVTLYANDPVEGVPTPVTVVVYNAGSVVNNAGILQVYLGEPGQGFPISEDIQLPGIVPKYNQYFYLTLNPINELGREITLTAIIDPDNRINETNESNNTSVKKLTVKPAPALSIAADDIAFSPTVGYEGLPVTIKATVHNTTASNVENVIVRFRHKEDGNWKVLGEKVVKFEGVQDKTVEFIWDSYGYAGDQDFEVSVDPDRLIYEKDDTNNIVIKSYPLSPAAKPDLTVQAGSTSTKPTKVARDSSCTLQAVICNYCDCPVENISVKFYDGDPQQDGTVIGTTLVSFSGRGETVAEASWKTEGLKGSRDIYVIVDPDNVVDEYNEENNAQQRTITLWANLSYQPQNLQANVNLRTVNLSWDPVSAPGVLGYIVFRDEMPLNPSIAVTHGTAKASSENNAGWVDHPARNAIDNDLYTNWMCSATDPTPWFEEEFAETTFISEMEISWSGLPYDYQIQIWNGTRYETVISVIDNKKSVSTHKLGEHGLFMKRYRIVVTKKNGDLAGIAQILLKSYQLFSSTTLTDSNLAIGNYAYTVSTLNDQGEESIPANSVTASVLTPAPPTTLTAKTEGNAIHLTWSPSTAKNCLGYYLVRNGEVYLGGTETIRGTASSSYSPSSHPEYAFDNDESTSWSCSSSYGISEIPLELNFTESRYISSLMINWGSTNSNYKIQVWNNNDWQTVATGYSNSTLINQIQLDKPYKTNKIRMLAGSPSYSTGFVINEIYVLAQKRLTDLSYTDRPLKAGNYEYKVVAEDSFCCESIPTIVQVTLNPPEKPYNLQATNNNESSVALSWEYQPALGFIGYLVYRNGSIINRSDSEDEIADQSKVIDSLNASTDKVTDRNANTYWQPQTTNMPVWLKFSFDSHKVITGITIDWYDQNNYSYAQDFLIQYNDRGSWKTIQSVMGNHELLNVISFSHPVFTNEIRILITKAASTYYGMVMEEAYIYGIALTTEQSYNDTNLEDGEYSYRVAAVDDAANVGYPSDPAFMTIGQLPSPTNLRATTDPDNVRLNWDISSMTGVDGFIIYRDGVRLNPPLNIAPQFSVSASYNNNLGKNINDNYNSSWWTSGANSYPYEIVLTSTQSYEMSKVILQWYSVAAKDYEIYVWINNDWVKMGWKQGNTELLNEITFDNVINTQKIKIKILSGPVYIYLAEVQIPYKNIIKGISYIDQPFSNGLYSYWVCSTDSNGKLSGESNHINIQFTEGITPAQPSNFRVSEQKASMLLQWTANTEKDLAGYNIYEGNSNTPINNSMITGVSCPANFKLGQTNYNFRLVAVDINGNQSPAAVASFQMSTPPAPTNPKITLDKRNSTYTWDAVNYANLYGYKVYQNGSLVDSCRYIIYSKRILASSVCFNSAYYSPDNVKDTNQYTYWRPEPSDSAPFIEFQSDKYDYVGAQVNWQSLTETPQEYIIQAYINDQWTNIITCHQTSPRQFITFPKSINTDRIRIVVVKADSLVSLADLQCFQYNRYEHTSYYQEQIIPGEYTLQVSAVNYCGMEGPRSELVKAVMYAKDISILPPDVIITPYTPSVLDNVTINITVNNDGTQTVDDVPVDIYVGDPKTGGIRLTTMHVLSVSPGQHVNIKYDWVPTGYSGEQTLFVLADPNNVIDEYNENNNICKKKIYITDSKSINLAINSIDVSQFPKVNMGIHVEDELGEGILGLTKDNFLLAENDTVQQITSITAIDGTTSSKAKVDIVFIVDSSGSMDEEWADMPNVIEDFVNSMNIQGIDMQYTVYYLYGNGTFDDINPNIYRVSNIKGLSTGIYQGNEVSFMNWAIFNDGGVESTSSTVLPNG